jgi:hypothetical protein
MVEARGMARERDPQFEWVNAWAAATRPPADGVAAEEAASLSDALEPRPAVVPQPDPAAGVTPEPALPAAHAAPPFVPEPVQAAATPEPAASAPIPQTLPARVARFVVSRTAAPDIARKPAPEIGSALPSGPPKAPELASLPEPAQSQAAASLRAAAPAPVLSGADQLLRDIAEIERARDALWAAPAARQVKAFMLVPRRAPDSAPLYIGGALALIMLMVFGAAATMTKFGR